VELSVVKISKQLRGTAIGILLIGSSSLVSVYLNSLGDDSKVINSAGIVRGGTQRLVKLELAGQPSDKLIENQNKLVKGLINGDSKLGLPAATNPEFRNQMQQVATAWQDLKLKIVEFRQNNQAKVELLDASEKYFELANQAVSAAEKYSTDKSERLRVIQLAIFAASLLLLITIWTTVSKITNTLKISTSDISTSFDQIYSVVKKEEQSIQQQALTIDTTNILMKGLQDLTQQSTVTAKISVDRVDQMIELLKKATETTRQNSLGMSSLQEKITSISNHLDSLEKQTIKIAKAAIPAAPAVLVNAGIGRQSHPDNLVERGENSTQDINKLFNNLQSSIAVITMVTKDSARILEIEVGSTQQNATDLHQAISTIDFLALNSQQMITTAKQYTSAVAQVTTLIALLNTGAQDTATSISQIKLSASQLGKTTEALHTKI
jgi:methyl-accepting chemotaxis protein